MLGVVGFLAVSIVPKPVYAGGGVGGGGDGSGGGGGVGNYTYYGYGWAQYHTNGSGPTDGFRDGTTWQSIQNTCNPYGATTVDVFIINDQNSSGMGYNYLTAYDSLSGHFPAGISVDHGKGFLTLSNAQAQADFNALPSYGVSTAGYHFGQNVAWLCSNLPSRTTYNRPSGNVNAARCQQQMHFNGINNGFDSNPQSFVVLTASGGNTPDRYPANGYRGGSSYDYNVPNWVSNRTGSSDVDVQLWVRDSKGNDIPVGTATILEPWGNCGNPGGNPTGHGGACTYFTATGSKDVRKEVHITGVSDGRGKADWSGDTWTHSADFDEYTPAPVGQNVSPGSYQKEWWYHPTSNVIHVTVNTWTYNGSSWPKTTNSYDVSCYSASCSINWVDGDGPWDGTYNPNGSQHHIVVTPGNMYVHGTFSNTSPGPDNLPMLAGAYLDGPNGTNNLGFVPYVGSPTDFEVDLTAPGSVQAYGLNFKPQYNASEDNMSGCSGQVPVYQYFNIAPSASVSGSTAENPTTVQYSTSGTLTTGPTVNANSTSWLTKQPFGSPTASTVDSHTANDNYGSVTHNYSWNNTTTINAGDVYCAYVTISPGHGYAGPGGYPNVATADNTAGGTGCQKTINRPYAHFQGSDVSAGGGFGKTCTPTPTGEISTYNESPGGVSAGGNGGSGAQFGAEAMSVISGLTSASLRTGSPTALSGLTFANNDSHIGGGPPARVNGGYMAGGSNFCVPDYFGDKPASLSTADTGVTATAGIGNAQQYYKPAGGTLTLSGGMIGNGHNQAIFVDGNVTITNNISYDATARGSVHDIPSFYLIVKNGNIHVNPGVTRLDGVYVAQPDMTSPTTISKTGIINSCWSAADTDPGHIYNNCKNQLVVNGSFVANKVLLTRSYSSLRYSQNGEHNLGGYAAHACGNPGKDVPPAGPTSASDCAAEIFNFNPELNLSQPGITPSYGASSGKYDAITSLSPVL